MQKGIDYEISADSARFVAGYIFAILGGIIGAFIGGNLAFETVTLPDLRKVKKFDKTSRMHGIIIFIISMVACGIWGVFIKSIQH